MEQENKTLAAERKKRAPNGTRTQVMFNFRLDKENAQWLDTFPNRGRYLNDLIKADREKYLSKT